MVEARRRGASSGATRIFLGVAALLFWRQICLVSGDAHLQAALARMNVENSSVVPRIHYGDVVPDIPLLAADGTATSLRRQITRPTVVIFAEAGCAQCKSELAAQAGSYRAINAAAGVVAVVLGRPFFGSPAAYPGRVFGRFRLPFRVFADPDRLAAKRILPQPLRMPEAMLFDAAGRLQWDKAGFSDTDGPDWAGFARLFADSPHPNRPPAPLADVYLTDSSGRKISLAALSFKKPVLVTLASGPGKCGACDGRLNDLAFFAQGRELTKIVAYSTPADARQWALTRSRDETGVSIDPFSSPAWCRPSAVPFSRLVWRGKVLLEEPPRNDNTILVAQVTQCLARLTERKIP